MIKNYEGGADMRRGILFFTILLFTVAICVSLISCGGLGALMEDKLIFASDGNGGAVLVSVHGYYGKTVDNVIMRICDVLMCLPTLPLMLIIGTVLDSNGVPSKYYSYLLMGLLSIFSWPGMARLVRGQILFLREQEYMVAAEAMGYSTPRRIFKHLIPNILPQILVSMTMSLGSMILYESTLSYLNLGVRIPYASWGTMIEVISKRSDILQNNFNVWGPPGVCIIIAVLGFNFIGDGLRDALDPKQRR